MVAQRLAPAPRGAALIEFTTVVALILLPLCLLALQLSLLTVTRRVLDVAIVLAARAGAAQGGDMAVIRSKLAEALTPLHVSAKELDARSYRVAATAASVEVRRADRVALQISQVAPPQAQPGPSNAGFDRRAGASSVRSAALLRANLLTLDLQYCAAMVVPVAAPTLLAVLKSPNDGAFDAQCYRQGRLPMHLRNTQVMQSTWR